jgi:hypothetical protein
MKSNLDSKIAKRMKLTYYHLPWMKLISSEALKHYKFTISQVCEITYVRYYLVVKVCCHFFVTLEWEYLSLLNRIDSIFGVVIIFVKVKQFGWVVYNFIYIDKNHQTIYKYLLFSYYFLWCVSKIMHADFPLHNSHSMN